MGPIDEVMTEAISPAIRTTTVGVMTAIGITTTVTIIMTVITTTITITIMITIISLSESASVRRSGGAVGVGVGPTTVVGVVGAGDPACRLVTLRATLDSCTTPVLVGVGRMAMAMVVIMDMEEATFMIHAAGTS